MACLIEKTYFNWISNFHNPPYPQKQIQICDCGRFFSNQTLKISKFLKVEFAKSFKDIFGKMFYWAGKTMFYPLMWTKEFAACVVRAQ